MKKIMEKEERCYNCGVILTNEAKDRLVDSSKTVEHIPAQCLYQGLKEEYKKNRLTVNGCNKCNNYFSKTDNEIRDAIGIMNDKDEDKKVMTEKSVRSIMRSKDGINRVISNTDGTISFSFGYAGFNEQNIKNFKGIFYSKYNYPFPDDKYKIITIMTKNGDENDKKLMKKEWVMAFYNHLINQPNWEISGHKDVFKYKFSGIEYGEKEAITTDDIEKADAIIGLSIYHKDAIEMLTVAINTEASVKMLEDFQKNKS